MSEDLTAQHPDVKALWSQQLSTALQVQGVVPLTHDFGGAPMLACQFKRMLQLAECRFGRRDTSCTIRGVEFIEGDPQIHYPSDCRHLVIRLGHQCLSQPDRAVFQLAHETIHLLDPTTSQQVTVLEEGLATHFQLKYMAEHYPPDWPRLISDWEEQLGSYASARSLVEQLLEEDSHAIKRMRAKSLKLSQITAEQIQDTCSGLAHGAARDLASKFEDFKKQGHHINRPHKA